MDLPTTEQAKRLKRLGLEWKPRYGDYYARTSDPDPELTVCGFPILVKGFDEIDWLLQNLQWNTWLPRLDQIMAEIERLVPEILIWFDFCHGQRRCTALTKTRGELAMCHGPNDTHAAAEALVKLMEKRVK